MLSMITAKKCPYKAPSIRWQTSRGSIQFPSHQVSEGSPDKTATETQKDPQTKRPVKHRNLQLICRNFLTSVAKAV